MRIPVTTYRLQFNREFRFADAIRIVDYLHDLGITDLYASPILKARPGSTHGYDVIDPTQINPEIGTPEEFNTLVEALQATYPYYAVRLCGGLLVIAGMGLMAYNYWKTVQQAPGVVQPVAVPQPA